MTTAWSECTLRCIDLFLENPDHTGGKSPLVHGPCNACITHVIQKRSNLPIEESVPAEDVRWEK